MKQFILFFILAVAIAGLTAYAGGWISSPRVAFAEKVATGLSEVSKFQAQALDTQALALQKMTDLNAEIVRAELDRVRAEALFYKVAAAALAVLVAVAVALAITVARRTARRAAESEA